MTDAAAFDLTDQDLLVGPNPITTAKIALTVAWVEKGDHSYESWEEYEASQFALARMALKHVISMRRQGVCDIDGCLCSKEEKS